MHILGNMQGTIDYDLLLNSNKMYCIAYLRLQEKVGCMGLPRFLSKAPFYNILHVGTHSCIVYPKLDNYITYLKGQNILFV